jgi:hypothetical protein
MQFKRIHLCPLAFLSAFIVQFLSKLTDEKMDIILFENQYISLDFWFLFHIFNTNMVIQVYKNSITPFWYTFCVIGWEVIENLIIPNLFPPLFYFKETRQNIVGDLFAAVPAYLMLTNLPV